MTFRNLLVASCFALAPGLAQDPAALRLSQLHEPPTAVQVARHGDETVVVGTDYKASFRGDTVTYRPRTGPDAPTVPIALRLRAVALGGQALPLPTGAFTVVDGRGERHGEALSERYDAALDQLEQSFVFAQLPTRGELVVDVAVTTALTVRADAEGRALHCTGDHVHVVCDRAVAVDAAGRRCDLAIEWYGDGYRLRVPASFVAAATLPLVVDPIVGNAFVTTTNPPEILDVAWSAVARKYVCAFDDPFAFGDGDLYLRGFDAIGIANGFLVLDISTNDTIDPAVAYDIQSDMLLVVFEQSGTIRGQRVHSALFGLVGGAFEIAGPTTTGQSGLHEPDVAGNDAFGIFGLSFLVAWTQISGSTAQLQMRPVFSTTALLPLTTAGIAHLRSAAIAPSRRGSDHWLVVAMTDNVPSNADLVALRVDAALGTLVSTTTLDASTRSTRLPDVSSPNVLANGQLEYLVASHVQATQLDVWVQTVTVGPGSVSAGAAINLQLLENGGAAVVAGLQAFPKVASNGATFCITYDELPLAATDFDARATILQDLNGVLRVVSARERLGFGGHARHTTITADAASGRFATLCVGTGITSGLVLNQLEATSASLRLTSCNGMVAHDAGACLPGGTVTFSLPAGLFGGFVVGPMATATPVPGCSCLLGVTPVALMPSPYVLSIPANAALIGATVSVQGFDLGVGTCFGALRLANVFDYTVQ